MYKTERRYDYFFLEFSFTIFIVIILLILFWETLGSYSLYAALAFLGAFCFSWFAADRFDPLLKPLMNICSLAVLGWMAYSVVNSSFFYRDVILILVKGLIIFEILLTFRTAHSNYLSYLQALTIPLLMSYPALIKEYTVFSVVLILAYLVGLFIILILKFYRLFEVPGEKARSYNFVYLPVIFLSISVLISWVIFSNLSLEKIRRGGFLPQNDVEALFESDIEEEYYDLQEKIQNRLSTLIPKLKASDDRYKVLALLNYLIKDSPHIIEVESAEQGLIDYFNRPGPGLEKGDTEGTVILLKEYLDKKASINLKKAKNNIMDTLKRDSFSLKEKVFVLTKVNKMQHSNSYGQVGGIKNELDAFIDKTKVASASKEELSQQIKTFAEWKTYELYRKGQANLQEVNDLVTEESRPATLELPAVEEVLPPLAERESPKLLSIVILAKNSRITLKDDLQLAAHGYFSDSSKSDISAQVEWKAANPKMAKIEQGILHPLKTGKVEVFAEYAGIKSSPVNIRIVFSKDQIISFAVMGIVFLVSGLIAAFIILLFLVMEEKGRLKSGIDSDPRRFMVDLYGNMRKVLSVFGLGHDTSLPPLLYAAAVEERYSIKDKSFSEFTGRFEEAKYSSRHLFEAQDAVIFLRDYNKLLKIFSLRHNQALLFLKYFLLVCKRRPFFV